ncbi:LysR family transcriptional regulator [Bacillus atrophaeus]|uniref:LysR family transcriptional regulator n=1 Tax=Bacillus atrophaeus TaxID=1452 RepID=UPI00227E4417|nr:LysR family transcriptional regulator [Bacillus atrophaeus]MCY8507013.1 LysR family transcriptional regulator [Bacillus atrophaeus]MCY8948795.1 LysR family transcriptional regulator [Bacillus atrophaeus]MCY8967212.1 LysR family transcriptional regulator [Bacillus atrophaeus]
MELKQLITFKTAAEQMNFTLTAKMLNYAQSSVTSQIKSLEAEIGTPLFERLGKRLVLTEAGRTFKCYAEQIITLTEEAKMAANKVKEATGTLKIGATESQCTYRLPSIIKEFKQAFPQVKLIFKPYISNEQAKEQLLQGLLDATFMMDVNRPNEALHIESLIPDEIKMVAAIDHPFSADSPVSPQDLQNETLLLTENGCSYRTLFEETLNEACVYPNKLEFVSIEAIKQCVMAGLGIAILPAMTVKTEIETGRMKELMWKNECPVFTQMAWHKDKWMSAPLEAFIRLTRKTFETNQ